VKGRQSRYQHFDIRDALFIAWYDSIESGQSRVNDVLVNDISIIGLLISYEYLLARIPNRLRYGHHSEAPKSPLKLPLNNFLRLLHMLITHHLIAIHTN
jgi:hypothetical protein